MPHSSSKNKKQQVRIDVRSIPHKRSDLDLGFKILSNFKCSQQYMDTDYREQSVWALLTNISFKNKK